MDVYHCWILRCRHEFRWSTTQTGGYTTDIVFERTKDYLRDFERQNDDNPWFVYLAPTSPHSHWIAEYEFRSTPVADAVNSPAYLEADISEGWMAGVPL